ncbi:hypothetical protein EDC01DRAFT_513348 [Geopyxis carbonaria]|nr:hypothetical protein EDC01DRAFT_513348 [Geopyxis carbonaria]
MSQASLKPAFLLIANLDKPIEIGQLSTGSTKSFVNVNSGSFKSLPGFTPAIDFTEIVVAGDWLTVDPDGQHARLNVRGTIRDAEGHAISLDYPGILDLTDPDVAKVFSGSEDAKTTKWGIGFTTPTFGASGKYKFLEDNVWVGSARFVVKEVEGPGKPFSVEYTVSQVVADREE